MRVLKKGGVTSRWPKNTTLAFPQRQSTRRHGPNLQFTCCTCSLSLPLTSRCDLLLPLRNEQFSIIQPLYEQIKQAQEAPNALLFSKTSAFTNSIHPYHL